MIEDHDGIYHVPMTCMVICEEIHRRDFSTLIVCGTVKPTGIAISHHVLLIPHQNIFRLYIHMCGSAT